MGFSLFSSKKEAVAKVETEEERVAREAFMEEERKRLERICRDLADQGCKLIEEISNSPGWEVWEEKDGTKIEKNSKSQSGTICGRGTVEWTGDGSYDLSVVEDYLWDDKSKCEYDEYTEAVLKLADFGDDYHIIDQIFKGRFGISGRDFMLCCHKKKMTTSNVTDENLRETQQIQKFTIGVLSVPSDEEAAVENLIEDPAVKTRYNALKKTVKRGTVFVGGFVATHNLATRKFSVSYINDADVKSTGVPQWIVTRVKLDQLNIVKQIPRCVQDFAKREETKIANNK